MEIIIVKLLCIICSILLIFVNSYILTKESHGCDIKIILLIYVDDEYTIHSRFISFEDLFNSNKCTPVDTQHADYNLPFFEYIKSQN